MRPTDRDALIYDWNQEGLSTEDSPVGVEFDDETLRDGLQSPSVRHPSLDDKLRLVRLMDALGIHAANIGLPGAGGPSVEHITRLAKEMRGLAISPNVACRTLLVDIEPVVDIVQAVGAPIEVCAFIGSSPLRQYAEGWDFDDIVQRSREAVAFCNKEHLPCMFVTEDTSRANPDDLRRLYSVAIEAGAQRICLADTVGHATPNGVRRLISFVRGVIDDMGVPVKIDWHGHRDRGLALANALAAIEAGASRIHGTALGVGERVGNTEMDLLLVNLRMRGLIDNDLSRLPEYCALASRAIGIPLPFNYPVFGKDAFETATGVHAAAVVKALRKDDAWLVNRVYSGVPADMVGLEQTITVGPMSGKSNVIHVLERAGVEVTERAVRNVLRLAKRASRLLTNEEVLAVAGASLNGESGDAAVREMSARIPLQLNEELYKRVYEESADAVIVADAASGRVRHANAMALELYSYTMSELVNLQIDDLCAAPSKAEAQRYPVPLLQLHTKRGGQAFPVEVSVSHMALTPGEPALMILMVRDVSEREAYEERLAYLGKHDLMTDLLNQSAFQRVLQGSLDGLPRATSPVGVCVLNLDRFRSVNDSFGHDTGDLVIREVAARLRRCIRGTDSVARSGGDEFAFLLEDTGDRNAIAQVCKRVLAMVGEPVVVGGATVHASGSIGVAMRFPGSRGGDASHVFAEASTAMQKARDQGGNGFRFYAASTDDAVQHRRDLELSLHDAIAGEQFVLHYQPQLNMDSSSMSMEALLRWQHPKHGLVPPLDFISALEDSGLIVPVGDWVLRTALRQLREWKEADAPAQRVAVNVSARQISSEWLASVQAALIEAGVSGSDLTIEITESVLIESDDSRRDILEALDALGIRISLDDFGTGYSSLSYLKRLPIRELKIDRSFIADIPGNADSSAIVDAILSLSASLELPVVVEGVETTEQLELLKRKGCRCIQGFLLAKPMPHNEASAWFQAGAWRSFLIGAS